MMLKTVYGPPPKDAERIKAVEVEAESCIREAEITGTTSEDLTRDSRSIS